jgi:hypothetical protein
MAFSRVRAVRRALAALVVGAAMLGVGVAGTASAEDTYDIRGTVIARQGPILTILTSDLTGREQPILVDVTWLRGLQINVGDPIHLTIQPREFDTYLATSVVRESPYVNGLEFGVQERFTVKQDSIQAGVGNVPEDDEALAKQHRDNNLRRDEDDDEDDEDDEERRRRD